MRVQSQSIVGFLIERGGRKRFLEFVEDGLENDNWAAAIGQYYTFADLSETQLA